MYALILRNSKEATLQFTELCKKVYFHIQYTFSLCSGLLNSLTAYLGMLVTSFYEKNHIVDWLQYCASFAVLNSQYSTDQSRSSAFFYLTSTRGVKCISPNFLPHQ